METVRQRFVLVWSSNTVDTERTKLYYLIFSLRSSSVSLSLYNMNPHRFISYPSSQVHYEPWCSICSANFLIWETHWPTHLCFFEDEDSVPVRAPPTEAPEMELDEYSGHQTLTEARKETRGQGVPRFSVFCSSLNLWDLIHLVYFSGDWCDTLLLPSPKR